jgi:hypothetical protein
MRTSIKQTTLMRCLLTVTKLMPCKHCRTCIHNIRNLPVVQSIANIVSDVGQCRFKYSWRILSFWVDSISEF